MSTEVCLSRQAILDKDDISIERCDVPEWGGFVYVKAMNARLKEKWEMDNLAGRGKNKAVNLGKVRVSLCAQTLCDAQGNLLFTLADMAALNEKSVKAIDRCYEAAMKLNRISEDDVDELVGNSESTQDESSPSA